MPESSREIEHLPAAAIQPVRELLTASQTLSAQQKTAVLHLLIEKLFYNSDGLENEVLEPFPVLKITRWHLEQLHLTEDEIVRLDRETLKEIAVAMQQHYLTDWFWDELEDRIHQRLYPV